MKKLNNDIENKKNKSFEFLNQLNCLECKLPLVFESKRIILFCNKCKIEIPVDKGIPRFVDSDKYVKNFSLEWNIHKTTQIDSVKYKESEKNFHERFGLPRSFWKGKKVLDVGVGVGRYAKVALDADAEVCGIDLSYAVDVAKENLKNYDKISLCQADIFSLPFDDQSFDVIYSFGVLHHTPDPQNAFRSLLRYLKPGGVICLTLYENHGMYHTSRYLRKLTTSINPKLLYLITLFYLLIMYLPYKYFGLRYGVLGRFAPISLSNNFSEAILDTYDCYSPKYQHTYSDFDVFSWFKEVGLQKIEVRPQPVTILGYK